VKDIGCVVDGPKEGLDHLSFTAPKNEDGNSTYTICSWLNWINLIRLLFCRNYQDKSRYDHFW